MMADGLPLIAVLVLLTALGWLLARRWRRKGFALGTVLFAGLAGAAWGFALVTAYLEVPVRRTGSYGAYDPTVALFTALCGAALVGGVCGSLGLWWALRRRERT
jgi:hypothetical protein